MCVSFVRECKMASNIVGIACAMLVMCCAMPSLALVYTVGDEKGWTTNIDYSIWTKGKNFIVGDTLVFNYIGGHTVDEVSASDYTNCGVSNIGSSNSSGTTTIPLNISGTYYFICRAVGHCNSGMKLTVTVGEISTPSPLASPPSIDTNPTPTPVPSSPPPTSSPSSSVIVSPSIGILLIVLSWFKLFLPKDI